MQEFTSNIKTEQFTIDGQLYEMNEMTTAGRDRYLKSLGNTVDVSMDGTGRKDSRGNEIMRKRIRVKDLTGQQTSIICATVSRVTEDGKRAALTPGDMVNWPARLQEKIANMASKMNGMVVDDGDGEVDMDADAEKN